jgi:enterochelin esterase-like enzyme
MIVKLLYGISLFLLTACTIEEDHDMSKHRIEEVAVDGLQLSVYLPPDYDENGAYPVAYFNDGQSLFGDQGITWALDKTLNRLIRKKQIQPIIVVGIHSDRDRTSHYVPYQDNWIRQNWGAYQPRAATYTQQIIDAVIPYIDSTYATIADRDNRAIMGSSLGGLHATWAALYYPDHFSMSAALSPSYWVADYQIVEDAAKAKADQLYYFDIGTGEWNYYVPMISALRQPYGEHVFYYEVPKAKHTPQAWGNRAHNALLLFAGSDPGEAAWEVEIEVIKSQSRANTFFLRMNPIIEFENGLTYSLSLAANYELLNPEDGEVGEDGSFKFTKQRDLRVKVSYKGESKEIKISYKDVERQKEG